MSEGTLVHRVDKHTGLRMQFACTFDAVYEKVAVTNAMKGVCVVFLSDSFGTQLFLAFW